MSKWCHYHSLFVVNSNISEARKLLSAAWVNKLLLLVMVTGLSGVQFGL